MRPTPSSEIYDRYQYPEAGRLPIIARWVSVRQSGEPLARGLKKAPRNVKVGRRGEPLSRVVKKARWGNRAAGLQLCAGEATLM